jgi:heme exporter protein C
LIYSAYFVLRASLEDETQRGRLSAVYNIFAYVVFIPLIFILPRMTDSLHPGSGDNPTFRLFDTAHTMKLVIYTAIAGFIALGWWLLTIFLRLRILKKIQDEDTLKLFFPWCSSFYPAKHSLNPLTKWKWQIC